ncbi:N-methyl-L-tryptophan oxidase [Nocardioides anomalus]|uniref:N-methyl-L-tryptophan oxidase n=1 Tax=Nocardioides anomalus TaxID=2712223 RepID=A0A6G6WGV0_9ACTN|nr:N-methyl-L-tryptophan oxidase [Nocardioides anomalus]QIG44439.1 N-methyl-L-tryptophan oxidase [Nocardioides anomalus]
MVERFDVAVVGLGGLGSAAAWELARRGHSVVGLERFGLGHSRGASHDTSRILRHSYHTPAYVRLTQEAYADWARLEAESGQALVTRTGGLDLFPADPAIPSIDYTAAMDEVGIGYDALDADQVTARWPALRVPPGTLGLHQEAGSIVPAGRTVGVLHDQARRLGADLRADSPVLGLEDLGDRIRLTTATGALEVSGVVVTADAWVNDVVGHLGLHVPVEVTLEQVTYYAVADPAALADLPLWIWMDDPSYYGFPPYDPFGGPAGTIKAAQDCGGPTVAPDDRTSEPDPAMEALLTDHLRRMLPAVGRPLSSVRCQYTLTPDRDFVLAPVPGHERVVVGLGAAHAFKFVPTFGRVLADLVTTGETTSDVSAFGLDRPALTQPDYAPHWLV